MKKSGKFLLGILLGLGIISGLQSCKKAAKEISEKIVSESAEKSSKEALENAGERSLLRLGERSIRTMDWKNLLSVIKREHLNLGTKIENLDRTMRKNVLEAMQKDACFMKGLTENRTAFDEFFAFAAQSPKAASDINLMKMFVNAKEMSNRFGTVNPLNDITLDEAKGMVRFIRKSDNKVIATYRKGVVEVEDAFAEGSYLFVENSLLKGELIPNALYKVKGSNGKLYLCNTDDLGRAYKIQAKGISANELMPNVVNRTEDVNLGAKWTQRLRTIRQSSRGDDLEATFIATYPNELSHTPKYVKLSVSNDRGKNFVSESFENVNLGSRKLVYTTAENSLLLNKIASRVGLSAEKKAKLLEEMDANSGLAALIHKDPEFNVKRWMNTRNSLTVAERKKLQSIKNLKNRSYAGNTFYFNPYLNNNLLAYLKRQGNYKGADLEKLLELDRKYPNGVKYSKMADPDFIGAQTVYKDRNGNPLIVTLPNGFTGNRDKDFNIARKILREQGIEVNEYGYYWHHLRGNPSRMVLVDADVHEIAIHTGGHSLAQQ